MTIKKIPNQVVATSVNNSELLPAVFNTVPNKKMLASTLDAMTSKGQLLPFTHTFGVKSAAERPNSFPIREDDPARAESQTNSAFIVQTDDKEYAGKASY